MTTKGRPQHLPIDWASDATISGAPAGNGLAPTLRPSAGQIAQGWHPLEPVEPRKSNYLIRDASLRSTYLDMLDAQNWIEGSETLSISTGSGNVIRGACALTWHSSRRLLAVGNGEDALESYDGGYTWDVAFTDGGGSMIDCCTREENAADENDLATAVLMYDGANIRIAMAGTSGGAWAQTTLTSAHVGMLGSSIDHARVAPDPYLGGFWVTGRTAGLAAVWRIVDIDGVYSSQARLEYGAFVAPPDGITHIAKGPTHGVAAAWDGAAGLIYRWANADAALSLVTHPETGDTRIIDLLWDHHAGMFLLFCEDNGSGFVKLYRSTTGATGTWMIQSMGAVNAWTGVRGGGCIRGSVIMLPVVNLTATPDRYMIAYSCDAGATWELQPNPLRRFPVSSTDWPLQRLRVLDRRFGALGYKGTGLVHLALGLRTGRELSEI